MKFLHVPRGVLFVSCHLLCAYRVAAVSVAAVTSVHSSASAEKVNVVTSVNWSELLTDLLAGKDLEKGRAYAAMDAIMSGQVSDAVLAAFLVALKAKGETSRELLGLADAMIAHAKPLEISGPAVDIVGTGGDRFNSVNVSTMASLVTAGAGVTVVKHGNRASSSQSGSADCLEALGIQLQMPPEKMAACAREVGITFCFAQIFHPSMKYAAAVRKELGISTVFNVLGPMTNPARVQSSAVGVADARLAPLMAEVFMARGDHALIFRGHNGFDELTVTGPAHVWEVQGQQVVEHVLDPVQLGMPMATIEDLRGGSASDNARVARRVLAGDSGPVRNTVLLNAAAALVAHEGHAGGTFLERMASALGRASDSIDSGAAADVLERWVTYSSSSQ